MTDHDPPGRYQPQPATHVRHVYMETLPNGGRLVVSEEAADAIMVGRAALRPGSALIRRTVTTTLSDWETTK